MIKSRVHQNCLHLLFLLHSLFVICSAFAPLGYGDTGVVGDGHGVLNASVSPEFSTSIKERHVELSSGARMQILSLLPDNYPTDKPPIIFVHGSFHGAWCWAEKFFGHFASQGYPVIAPSWRGTGGTYAGDGVKKVKIMEHVADFKCLLNQLREIASLDSSSKPPVVVAHSFGGLAVMKALEDDPTICSKISGIVMMCSVPPSGNGKMTMRYLKRSLVDSYKITVGFAMKRCLQNEDLCRQLFFGGSKKVFPDGSIEDYGVSDADVKRFQEYFARDSAATIDLLDLAKKLPSQRVVNGRAPFVDALPPCLVIGAIDDFIVDKEGVAETATYFGVARPIMVDSPHDVMLGSKWKHAAEELSRWLKQTL